MSINPLLTKGSVVGFNSASRLRKISTENKLLDLLLQEGVLIGEDKIGEIQGQIDEGKGFVVLVDTGHLGWVYNYEVHALDTNDPKLSRRK